MAEEKKKKSKQPTVPKPIGEACTLGRRIAKGLESGGTAAGIKYASATDVRVAAEVLLAAEAEFQAVLSERTSTLNPALKAADGAGREFIKGAKKVVGFSLGDKWSQAWSEVGYLNNNLECPGTLVERETLLQSIARYLAAHSQLEAPAQNITAEKAVAVHHALAQAQEAIDANDTLRKERSDARAAAEKALRILLSGVIHEVRQKLPIDSPLWDSFGLSAPKPRPRKPASEKKAKAKGTAAKDDGESGASGTVVSMAA